MVQARGTDSAVEQWLEGHLSVVVTDVRQPERKSSSESSE